VYQTHLHTAPYLSLKVLIVQVLTTPVTLYQEWE